MSETAPSSKPTLDPKPEGEAWVGLASNKPCLTVERIGPRGGEGSVYFTDRPGMVAKIWHPGSAERRRDKLLDMLSRRTAELESLTAWPREELARKLGDPPAGFLMPLVAPAVPLGDVIVPSARLAAFPWAGYDTVVQVAASMAAAMAALHDAGIVMGDVSESNTAVLADGSVRFWDCDSFQVPKRGGGTWRCLVGHPDFTAPEYQGLEFATTDRTASSDVFALSVMLFRILTCGRHPFDAQSLDGDFERCDAIERGWYMCRPDAQELGLRVPAGMVTGPWDWPSGIAEMFLLALTGEPDQRPTAGEWATALRSARRQMVHCSEQQGHAHFKGGSCPWCRLESIGGPELWPTGAQTEAPDGLGVLGDHWKHPWVLDPRIPEEELSALAWPEAPPLPPLPETQLAPIKRSKTPDWSRVAWLFTISIVWSVALISMGVLGSQSMPKFLQLVFWLGSIAVVGWLLLRRPTSKLDDALRNLSLLHGRLKEYIGGPARKRFESEVTNAKMWIERLQIAVTAAGETLGLKRATGTDEGMEEANRRLEGEEAREMAERIAEAVEEGRELTPELEQEIWAEVREAHQAQRQSIRNLAQPMLFNPSARAGVEEEYGSEIKTALGRIEHCLESIRTACEGRRRQLLQSEASIPELVRRYAEMRAVVDSYPKDWITSAEARLAIKRPKQDLWRSSTQREPDSL